MCARIQFHLSNFLDGPDVEHLHFLSSPRRFSQKQAIAIGMEIGIHNGTLAIYIALNVIGNGTMTIPAVVYSIMMFLTAAVFAWLVNVRRNPISS